MEIGKTTTAEELQKEAQDEFARLISLCGIELDDEQLQKMYDYLQRIAAAITYTVEAVTNAMVHMVECFENALVRLNEEGVFDDLHKLLESIDEAIEKTNERKQPRPEYKHHTAKAKAYARAQVYRTRMHPCIANRQKVIPP